MLLIDSGDVVFTTLDTYTVELALQDIYGQNHFMVYILQVGSDFIFQVLKIIEQYVRLRSKCESLKAFCDSHFLHAAPCLLWQTALTTGRASSVPSRELTDSTSVVLRC